MTTAIDKWNPKEYLLGGKAIVTVANPGGERYTYRISSKEVRDDLTLWFVSLLVGPDNNRSYAYLGCLNPETGDVRLTQKSRYTEDTLPVKVARWAFKEVMAGRELPEGYKFYHAGSCGRCGRTLTVPESIESGFGPYCIQMIGR